MPAGKVINRIHETIKIIRRGDTYYGVLKSPVMFMNELIGRIVLLRMFVNGNEVSIRVHVTIEKAYIPPRPRVIFPKALNPFVEKIHGKEIPVVIEYEEDESNEIKTQSG